jgi:hypothetical protein
MQLSYKGLHFLVCKLSNIFKKVYDHEEMVRLYQNLPQAGFLLLAEYWHAYRFWD